MRAILVTGCAGFIGFHVTRRLLADGKHVVGLDNLNPYYDPQLKQARLDQLLPQTSFTFIKQDIADRASMESLFSEHQFDSVVHLAAQAGVRYSLKDPHAYVESNLVGFANILEGCRQSGISHLVFASSSSVYGANTHMPFSVHDGTDHPMSLYAATKKANEMMAHSYAHLYGLPATGLRFFTVYGPWGRPDMALFLFTRAILEGKPIDVYNFGKMRRDFTFIDDIVNGVYSVMNHVPQPDSGWNSEHPDPASSSAPYRIYNIGNTRPADLMTLIEAVERKLGKKAQTNLLPIEPGDAPATWSDVEDLKRDTGFTPKISIEEGVSRFVDWYREYYRV
jgi:UDP-glucuronate 4-epimerase